MKSTRLLFCMAALCGVFATAKSQAQNVSAQFTGVSPMLIVQGTFNDGGTNLSYYSGVAQFTEFDAFCVDPVQSIVAGEALVYQIQDVQTLVNSEKVGRLVGGYLQSSRSAQDAAAVQWAIWETVAENTLPVSLADGNTRITGTLNQDTLALANQYLCNINTYTPVGLTYLKSETRQDMVTWCAVPEPGTAGLGLVSCLLLLHRRRR